MQIRASPTRRRNVAPGSRGGCAEGFATHQLRIGNEEVVRDFLRFLQDRLADLERDGPEGLRAMTEGLAGRIRERLEGCR